MPLAYITFHDSCGMRLQQVGALLLLAALLLAGAEAGKYKGGRLGKARALPKEQR